LDPSGLRAQIIDQATPPNPKATISLDHGSVRAGETVGVTISLDPALAAGAQVQINFSGAPANQDGFSGDSRTTGAESVTFSILIPKDLPGGDYKATQVVYFTGRRWSTIDLPAPVSLKITPLPNTPILPSRATVKLDFDQRQFIRMQAEPVDQIRQDLIQELAKDASDSPTLRADLIAAVSDADELIPSVKTQYLTLYQVKPVLDPVLFDDFDIHYKELLVELKAPSWPNPSVSPVAHQTKLARMLQVQLKPRPTVPNEPDGQPNSHVLTVYPPYAENVLNLLSLNIRAYRLLAIAGVDTFSIRLASRPRGATVFYTRVGQPYAQLSERTIIDQATFPYAMWTFRFVLAGCQPYIEEANPYIEAHPNIDAELVCKSR
jgi:hypothetical protein